MFGQRIKQKRAGIEPGQSGLSFQNQADFIPSNEWEDDGANLSTINREIEDIRRELNSQRHLESRLATLQKEKRTQIAKQIQALQKELTSLGGEPEIASPVPTGAETASAQIAPEVSGAPLESVSEVISIVPDDAVVEASGAAMEAPIEPELPPVERAQSIDELVTAVDLMVEIPQGFSMTNASGGRVLGKAGWKWTLKEVWAGRMSVDMLPDDHGFKSKMRELRSFSESAGEEPAPPPKKEESPTPEAVTPWNNPSETFTVPEPMAIDVASAGAAAPEAKPMTESEKTRAALLEKLNKVRELKKMGPVVHAMSVQAIQPAEGAVSGAAGPSVAQADVPVVVNQDPQNTEDPLMSAAAAEGALPPQAGAVTPAAPISVTAAVPTPPQVSETVYEELSSLIEQASESSLIQDPPGREESIMKALLTGDYRFLRTQTPQLTPREKNELMDLLRMHKITDERFEELLSHVASPSVIITEQMAAALARAAYASPAKDALKIIEIFVKGDPAMAEAAFDASGLLCGDFFIMLLEKLPTPVKFERFVQSLEERTKADLLKPSLDDPDGARKKREALALILKNRGSFAKLEELLYGERLAYWQEFKRIEKLALTESAVLDTGPGELGSAYVAAHPPQATPVPAGQ